MLQNKYIFWEKKQLFLFFSWRQHGYVAFRHCYNHLELFGELFYCKLQQLVISSLRSTEESLQLLPPKIYVSRILLFKLTQLNKPPSLS